MCKRVRMQIILHHEIWVMRYTLILKNSLLQLLVSASATKLVKMHRPVNKGSPLLQSVPAEPVERTIQQLSGGERQRVAVYGPHSLWGVVSVASLSPGAAICSAASLCWTR